MLNVISIIQCIDQVFTNLIFIPMVFVRMWNSVRKSHGPEGAGTLTCSVWYWSAYSCTDFLWEVHLYTVNYPRSQTAAYSAHPSNFLSRHLKMGISCHLVRIWDQYPLASYGNSSPAYLQYKYTVRTGYSRTRYVSCMYKRGENRWRNQKSSAALTAAEQQY